jgi:hypothetical protein
MTGRDDLGQYDGKLVDSLPPLDENERNSPAGQNSYEETTCVDLFITRRCLYLFRCSCGGHCFSSRGLPVHRPESHGLRHGRKCYLCQSDEGAAHLSDLDAPYPRQIFTVVIWGSDRRFFNNAPEVLYRGKKVCVTGLVKSFRGKPEITVLLPSQIAQQ